MEPFDLLTEPWIPVLTVDGRPDVVSLRDTLARARDFRRIDAGLPLQTVALYRLHLALLHRALRGPRDAAQAADWFLNGFPEAEIEAYLARFGDRFDLFDPRAPFLQVPDLTTELEGGKYLSHWTRLSAEEGSANTTSLFNPGNRPAGERRDAISPAEAARRLLEHQTFALGGLIKRFTTAARAAPVATAALFLAEGEDLHETLVLNLVPYSGEMAALDAPAWERPALHVDDVRGLYDPEKPRTADGFADRYVWQSRAVRLEREADGGVRFLGFAAGVPLLAPGEGTGANVDPMVARRRGGDPKDQTLYPLKLRREQLLWRDITALLPDPGTESAVTEEGGVRSVDGEPPSILRHAGAVLRQAKRAGGPADFRARRRRAHPVVPVVAFGQVTDQGKAFTFRQETYTLPEAFVDDPGRFRDEVGEALKDAKLLGDGLRSAVRRLAQEVLGRGGEREPHKDDVSKLAGQLPAEANYWAQLETPFRTYLAALDGDVGAAQAGWRTALARTARSAWATAVVGVGDGATALRAVQKAEGLLLAVLRTLTPSPSQGEP